MSQRPFREPGRNDPCPCGSGRKYKQCCLGKHQGADMLRLQLREAEGRLVPRIVDWAVARWPGFFEEAWEEFHLWEGVPEDPAEVPDFEPIFIPWMVFSFVPDLDFPDEEDEESEELDESDEPGLEDEEAEAVELEEAELDGPDGPAALVYLEEHAEELDGLDRRFLAAACESAFSFHQVVETTPGRDILLRDILTGRERRVLEQSGSTMVERHGILFARPITIDEASILIACAPLVIPPSWHNHIIDLRQRMARRGKVREDALAECEMDIRELYLHIAETLRNPKLPALVNTDGEPLVLTTLDFELRCSVELAFERLSTLSLYDKRDLLEGAERGPDGALRKVEFAWLKRGNRKHRSWDNTVLAHLTLTEGRLAANVNSKRRADRLRREVAKRLGRDVVFSGAKEEPPERLMKQVEQRRKQGVGPGRTPEVLEPLEAQSPEVRQEIEEMMARHWDAWLDERIPALGNRTPRQAARTALGRERLEALFAEYEWRSEQTQTALRPDVKALRAKLGM